MWLFSWLVRALWLIVAGRPEKPAPLILSGKGIEDMSRIAVKVKLPKVGASDVSERRLYVGGNAQGIKVNDVLVVQGPPIVLPVTAEFVKVSGEEDTDVLLRLADVDKHGNVSEQSDALAITFADTFAPPKPGPLVIDGEETEEADDEE